MRLVKLTHPTMPHKHILWEQLASGHWIDNTGEQPAQAYESDFFETALKPVAERLGFQIQELYHTEACPHCDLESDMPYAFASAPCQHCGEVILPCAMCEHKNCLSCPLEAN